MQPAAQLSNFSQPQHIEMAKPTTLQRAQAISDHIEAVGKIGLSAYEVALTLDGRHPGMTDKEFVELQSELQPEIQAARSAGLHAIWK